MVTTRLQLAEERHGRGSILCLSGVIVESDKDQVSLWTLRGKVISYLQGIIEELHPNVLRKPPSAHRDENISGDPLGCILLTGNAYLYN